ncbi:MAG: twin-arginine translocase TatA/TatE family subunit [Candidatus Methanospirareceae archaeon]
MVEKAMIGPTEMMVIGIVAVVLLFGASKVPQLARSFGQAMGEFKKAKREAELNLKRFEESIAGDEVATPRTAETTETKSESLDIKEVAAYMGIDTEGKTEKELKEEVEAKMKASKSEKR